jgi:hypothetical protein
MTAVILIIDELIDQGTVMMLNEDELIERIKVKKPKSAVPALAEGDGGA